MKPPSKSLHNVKTLKVVSLVSMEDDTFIVKNAMVPPPMNIADDALNVNNVVVLPFVNMGRRRLL